MIFLCGSTMLAHRFGSTDPVRGSFFLGWIHMSIHVCASKFKSKQKTPLAITTKFKITFNITYPTRKTNKTRKSKKTNGRSTSLHWYLQNTTITMGLNLRQHLNSVVVDCSCIYPVVEYGCIKMKCQSLLQLQPSQGYNIIHKTNSTPCQKIKNQNTEEWRGHKEKVLKSGKTYQESKKCVK